MTIQPPKPLRDGLTGFGLRLAAVLEPASPDPAVAVRWAVLTPAAAVEPMRTLLRRRGLEHAQALRQGDGSMRPTWSEMPEIWIRGWTEGDSAIVLKADNEGPCELRFLMCLADATVKTVMRIGDGPRAWGLRRALWDLGITSMVGVVAEGPFADKLRARGIDLRARSEGQFNYVYVIPERPEGEGEPWSLS